DRTNVKMPTTRLNLRKRLCVGSSGNQSVNRKRPLERRSIRMKNDKRKGAPSRRKMLGATAAAVNAGALSPLLFAQKRADVEKAEQSSSASNPGPINKALAGQNLGSNFPPSTDRGDVMPIWYSFDLTHRRIQDGGWTRQVTAQELP